MEPQNSEELKKELGLYFEQQVEGIGTVRLYGKPNAEKILKVLLESEAIMNG